MFRKNISKSYNKFFDIMIRIMKNMLHILLYWKELLQKPINSLMKNPFDTVMKNVSTLFQFILYLKLVMRCGWQNRALTTIISWDPTSTSSSSNAPLS